MIELSGKKVLIVGLGITGRSLAFFCKKRGARVTVTDIDKNAVSKISEHGGLYSDIKKEIGFHKTETFENSDLIILSPGVSHNIGQIASAKAKGIQITGEIEFASKFIKTPIIAVTGTNGKTTVTTLIGEILRYCGKKVFVGGNIGKPLIDYLDTDQKSEAIVAELSSFQLDTTSTFKPKIAALLNISEDHLERYKNFREYADSKMKIFANQDKNDTAVINGNDPLIRSFMPNIKSKKLLFYPLKKERGSIIDFSDKKLIFDLTGSDIKKRTLSFENINLIGRHNVENIAAASLCALAAGASIQGIEKAVRDFKGIRHRIEYVDTISGIAYYNDSKATNTDAVSRALEYFDIPLILIMGGIDKGGSLDILKPLIKKRVKRLIVIGEAKKKIVNAFSDLTNITTADTLEEAIYSAHKTAKPGEAVLLSPGCSSFDMFRSYAHRGEVFCKTVQELRRI